MSRRKSLNLGGNTSPSEEPIIPEKKQDKAPKEEKARVTHYLSTETLSELEEVYDEIRRRLPYSEKPKVKKSHLVEFALDYLVNDYHKKGDKSLLTQKFLK